MLLTVTVPGAILGSASAGAPSAVFSSSVQDRLVDLGPAEEVSLVVTFEDGADADALARAAGLDVVDVFEPFPIAFMHGTVSQFRTLAGLEDVRAIEENRQHEYHLETATEATRVTDVQRRLELSSGNVSYDGSGVGIAVVDSGVDCTHPDLADACDRGANYRQAAPFVRPPQYVQVPNSDDNGHGTHVAGIAAGDGTASGGHVKGVAPGAALYAYGHGATIFVVDFLAAWSDIVSNQVPNVSVVSNSFGSSSAASVASSTAVRNMVANGLTVVFSAGNSGSGGGGGDTTNGLCEITKAGSSQPLPGVICVANYGDAEIGTAEGGIAFSSSRGVASDNATWPDVSAPGLDILSTKASTNTYLMTPATSTKYGETRARDTPFYMHLSGTSMSAPHVSGVVALMQEAARDQANTDLTPATVEQVINGTAHDFDTYEPFDNKHAGHGLVDAQAAVERAINLTTGNNVTGDDNLTTPMDEDRQKKALAYSGIVFSGSGIGLNAGAVGSTANTVTDLEGFGQPFGTMLPDTNVITPGATQISTRAFMDDAGGSEVGYAQPNAQVTVDITYQSGTTFTDTMTFSNANGWWTGSSFPYTYGISGDVTATFTFDADGDGSVNSFADATVTVVYEDGL